MDAERDIPDLWLRFCAGDPMSVDEKEVLLEAMSSDVELRRRVLGDARLDGFLRTIARCREDADIFTQNVLCRLQAEDTAADFEERVRRRLARPTGRPVLFQKIIPLAAAAAVLVAVGTAAWLMVDGSWLSGRGAVLARVEEVSGFGVFAFAGPTADRQVSGRTKSPLSVGDEIFTGMKIETRANAKVVLQYTGEMTKISLRGNSELEIRDLTLGHLKKGRLEADVAKRPAGKPFVVTTPHARAMVLGTRFRVEVSGFKSQADPLVIASTRLHVEEGLVRLTRLSDEACLDVAAGQFAVVGKRTEDFALKTYAAGTEWVDGPIILQDDFEKGFDRWEVYAPLPPQIREDPLKYKEEKAQFIKGSQACVKLITVQRDGKSTRVVSFRPLKYGQDGHRQVGIRLRRPIGKSRFSLQFDRCVVKAPRSRPEKGDQWEKRQTQVCLTRSPDGHEELTVRRIRENGRRLQKTSRDPIDLQNLKRGFLSSKKHDEEMRYDNVVIRELVPVVREENR